MSEKKQEEPLSPVPSNAGQVTEGQHDAVFGEITGEGPNYRNVCVFILQTSCVLVD